MTTPRLLLLGCGHSHLFVLEALARGEMGNVRATLVSPEEEYFYSGMIPGVIAGSYRPEAARFRPRRLAAAAGAEFIAGTAERVDTTARRVHLRGEGALPYDLLSIDIGSRPAGLEIRGAADHALTVKPMHAALRILPAARGAIRATGEKRPARIAIAGAGAAGVEVGLCLDARLRREAERGDRHHITVVEAGDEILAELPRRSRRLAERILERREIETRLRAPIEEVTGDELRLGKGGSIGYDVLVWALGPAAPPLPAGSGLPTDDEGYLLVEPSLRVPGHPLVFGAGDCVRMREHPWVPRAGVYAVREGPVLARNLARALRAEPLERYEPQRRWLSLLNTGDGRALLSYRGLGLHNRPAWWLKDRIDRRFINRFQSLERSSGS